MRETLLEVRNLKKYFNTPAGMLHAVDDVSFEIPKGKTMGVVGESGCGKSTLGRTLLCLDQPTSGEFYLDGQSIRTCTENEVSDIRLNKIGVVLQSVQSLKLCYQ